MIEQWLFQELIYHVWLAKRLNNTTSDIKLIEKNPLDPQIRPVQFSDRHKVNRNWLTVSRQHSFEIKAQNKNENTVMIWTLDVQLLVTFENRNFTSPFLDDLKPNFGE